MGGRGDLTPVCVFIIIRLEIVPKRPRQDGGVAVTTAKFSGVASRQPSIKYNFGVIIIIIIIIIITWSQQHQTELPTRINYNKNDSKAFGGGGIT